MSSSRAEDIIQRDLERWDDYEGLLEMTLLRKTLLRELTRNIHAEQSKCLATGKKTEAEELKKLEFELVKLRDLTRLSGPFTLLLQNCLHLPKKSPLLSEAIFAHLEREKFDRYDRQWESRIAAEAATLNWHFWKLEAWVEIEFVEDWNSKLTTNLWPRGIVLFVESSKFQSEEGPTDGTTPAELWCGIWHVIIHPDYRNPQELPLILDKLPGAPMAPPSPPVWKFLY